MKGDFKDDLFTAAEAAQLAENFENADTLEEMETIKEVFKFSLTPISTFDNLGCDALQRLNLVVVDNQAFLVHEVDRLGEPVMFRGIEEVTPAFS